MIVAGVGRKEKRDIRRIVRFEGKYSVPRHSAPLDPHINSDQHTQCNAHPLLHPLVRIALSTTSSHLRVICPLRTFKGKRAVDEFAMKVRIKEWSAVATWGESVPLLVALSRVMPT